MGPEIGAAARSLSSIQHEIQLLTAFAPHTGQAVGVPSPTKTGEVVLTFLQDRSAAFSAASKIYVVWDNFSAHK